MSDTSDAHFCPDRVNAPPAFAQAIPHDTWDVKPNGDRCCSWCGSLHFEDFKRILARAADMNDETLLDRSTKSYKLYVRSPNVSNASEGGIKFYTWHIPEGEEIFIRDAVVASDIKLGRRLRNESA